MTQGQLDNILGRADLATPSPWQLDNSTSSRYPFSVQHRESAGVLIPVVPPPAAGGGQAGRNLNFIAHAREDVPALICEVLRCKSQIEELRQKLVNAGKPETDVAVTSVRLLEAIQAEPRGTNSWLKRHRRADTAWMEAVERMRKGG